MKHQLERVSTVILGTLLIAAIVGVGVFAVAPIATEEPHTAFFVTNSDGTAADYFSNASVGEEVTLRVGIDNREHELTRYTLVATSDGEEIETKEIALEDEEQWRGNVSVVLDTPGNKTVELALYRGSETSGEPYRKLRVVGNVSE